MSLGANKQALMGAAGAAGGGANFYTHQIANSVRIPATSSTSSSNGRLTKTFGTVDSSVHWTLNFWIKRSALGGTNPVGGVRPLDIFTPRSGTSGSVLQEFKFCSPTAGGTAGDALMIVNTNSNAIVLSTNNLFRDTSAWYNIHIQADLDNGTNSERLKFFINGTEASYNTDNRGSYTSLPGITAGAWTIGDYYGYGYPIQSYFAAWAYVDGSTLAHTVFGESKNGVWIPKDLSSGITWGSAGHLLDFADSSALGNDVSGNNNDWAVANIATHDQMLDSPTFGSSSSGNFCTMNPISISTESSVTSLEGNLFLDGSTTSPGNYEAGKLCTMGVRSGKWYWEVYLSGGGATTTGQGWAVGIASTGDLQAVSTGAGPRCGGAANGYAFSNYAGLGIFHNNSITTYGTAPANLDIIGFALDLSTPGSGSFTIYKNNVSLGVAVNGSIADAHWVPYIGLQGGTLSLFDATTNFGQDSTFAGAKTAGGNADANGHGDFYYAPPTGYLAMCTGNLPTADSIDPSQTDDDYPQKLFTALAYTGGTTGHVTGFKPDWVWVKARSTGQSHGLFDSNRGTTKILNSNSSAVESTSSGLTAFNTDGYDMGTYYNQGANTYASWNWRTNGGTTSTNTSGSVNSTVQADPSGAFSVVTWTGGGGNATLGHGLSGAPTFMAAKSRTSGAPVMDWPAFHKNMNNGAFPANESRMYWSDAGGYGAGALWQTANNSASLFGVTYNINDSGKNYVAYCFTDVEGYCKAGYYVGNGSTDNAFVYLGFRPAWIMIKGLASGSGWNLHDNATSPYNVASTALQVNSANAELTNYNIDMLSNGFKVRDADGDLGTNGNKYIYLAMAHNPFKYATAR